jgi:hypothetical protein
MEKHGVSGDSLSHWETDYKAPSPTGIERSMAGRPFGPTKFQAVPSVAHSDRIGLPSAETGPTST